MQRNQLTYRFHYITEIIILMAWSIWILRKRRHYKKKPIFHDTTSFFWRLVVATAFKDESRRKGAPTASIDLLSLAAHRT